MDDISHGRRQDPRTDEELVLAVNGGREEAFDALYYRYRDWVARLAHRFTGNRDDALDVLQETFAYLAGKFPGFRLTARMTSFLYPVVRHLSMNVTRRRSPAVGTDGLPELAARADDPPAGRAELAAVLRGLSEPKREVVLMRFVDDMSLAEIADALDVPLGTVKSRLHGALADLRADPRTRDYFGA